MQLPYYAYVTAFLQTDLFLVHLFFCERKAVPVQWRSDINEFFVIGQGTPTGVSIPGKFNLKIKNENTVTGI